MDVGMSSIQAYKAHNTGSGCMIIVGYTNHLVIGRVAEYPLWLFDLQKDNAY